MALFQRIRAKGFLLALSLITFGPIIILLTKSLSLNAEDQTTWTFLINNVVPELFSNTFFLLIGSLLGSLIIGVGGAFLISFTNLPGKKVFHPLFIIPLAFPLYVLAFVYAGMFDYSGSLMSFFRESLGINLTWFKIRSLPGACFTFSLALSPYVYLLARGAFASINPSLIMSARSLGKSPWQVFLKIILPYSRPWILGASVIVAMETLADFGGVSALNVDTFTTAIYSAWSGFFSLSTAARLSCLLIVLAMGMLYLEKHFAKKTRYHSNRDDSNLTDLIILSPFKKGIFLFITISIVLISSIIPFIQLCLWAFEAVNLEWSAQYIDIIKNTMIIGFLASLIITSLSFILTFINRYKGSRIFSLFSSLTLFGYALPGNIIAVAVFLFFAYIQNFFNLQSKLGAGSLLILIVGLAIRFLSVGYRPQENSQKRISENIDRAARSLGAKPFRLAKNIYIPLLSKAMLTSFLLLFIEVVKEMPMTLMLRPFSMNTLSVKIYELTSEGEWERASLAAIFLVCLGLIGTLIMSRLEKRV